MKKWWQGLGDRERHAVFLLTATMVVFLIWLTVWRPLSASAAGQADRIARLEDDSRWLAAAAAEARLLQSAPLQTGNRAGLSLLALADQSARGIGLGSSFRGGEPVGEDGVRIRMEAAKFDDVVRWMELLEDRYGVVVTEATVSRTGSAGLVNLNALLTE